MIDDKLYTLAFEYKKTKLWKTLYDMELFALRLADGRIGYISIIGAKGEDCAVSLYIGEEGWNSFCAVTKADEYRLSPLEFQEEVLKQNCLQCAFEKKEELSKKEQEKAKNYARAHGIRFRGKNAYPRFMKYQPNHYPWYLQEDNEKEDLCEALTGAIEMAKLLEKSPKEELGICSLEEKKEEILLLEFQEGTYSLSKIKLPERKQEPIPMPENCNEIGMGNLKKMKRNGIWECEILQYPEPIQNHPEEVPYFPYFLLIVETATEYMLPVSPAEYYKEAPEELLNLMIEAFLEEELCPREIRVCEERTYAFLESFCRKLKIKLSMKEELLVLRKMECEFLRYFYMGDEEEMEEVTNLLNYALERGQINTEDLPEELMEEIRILLKQEALPEETAEKLCEIFGFGKEEPRGRLKKSDFQIYEGKNDQK